MKLGWFYAPDENGKVQVGEKQDTFWSITKECQEDEDATEETRYSLMLLATTEENQFCVNTDDYIFHW